MSKKQLKILLDQIASEDFDTEGWRNVLRQVLKSSKLLTLNERVEVQKAALRSPVADLKFLQVRLMLMDRSSWRALGDNPMAALWLEDTSAENAKWLKYAVTVDYFDMVKSLDSKTNKVEIVEKFIDILKIPPWSDIFHGEKLVIYNELVTDIGSRLSMFLHGLVNKIRSTQKSDSLEAIYIHQLIHALAKIAEVPVPSTTLCFLDGETT